MAMNIHDLSHMTDLLNTVSKLGLSTDTQVSKIKSAILNRMVSLFKI